MRKQFLECGEIVGTHGVKGEVKLSPWADSPEYVTHFSTLYLEKGSIPLTVLNARVHKGMVLLMLKDYNTIEKSEVLRGEVVYIDRDDDPESHRPFVQDLFGIHVTDVDTGESYGKITEVLDTGAHPVYILTDKEGTERLIPAIDQVIIEMDIGDRTMEIRPLEGLFDLEN